MLAIAQETALLRSTTLAKTVVAAEAQIKKAEGEAFASNKCVVPPLPPSHIPASRTSPLECSALCC
jgi:hypothetical protein